MQFSYVEYCSIKNLIKRSSFSQIFYIFYSHLLNQDQILLNPVLVSDISVWFVVLQGDINLHMLSYVGQKQRDSLIKPGVRVMKGSVCGGCLSSV